MDQRLESLKSALEYIPASGIFRWKECAQRNFQFRREFTGIGKTDAYARVQVKGKNWLAHRLAWFMHYGEEPAGIVDHINGDRFDNRIENLRVGDSYLNNRNREKHRSGLPLGVSRRGQKFTASVVIAKKNHWLGTHETCESASNAVQTFWKARSYK